MRKKQKYILKYDGNVVGNKMIVDFIPAETINCHPPYIAGKRNTCWVRYRNVDEYNKQQCEEAVGMKLLPIK